MTDMSRLFFDLKNFNEPIGSWNVSAVTNMSHLFDGATTFNQPIGSWNTAGVTDMSYMFSNAEAFNQPIGSWNVSAVTTLSHLFSNAEAFNQPLSSWDISNVYYLTKFVNGVPTLVQPPCPAGNFQAPRSLGFLACQTGRWAPEGSLQCHGCPQNSIPADDQSRCEDFEDCPALQFAFDGAECVWWHLPLLMLAIIAFLVSRHLFHLLGFCLYPLGHLHPYGSAFATFRHFHRLSCCFVV